MAKGQVVVMLLAILTAGCAYNSSFQIMGAQPRYDPLSPSAFFADGTSARQPVADTVARGNLRDDTTLFDGQTGGQVATAFPFTVTRQVLLRGQERYDVFCAPCHGRTGDGNGMIVQRGFPRAASFHSDRMRAMPVGQYFAVITNGFGDMPTYASQIPERDRWAIIAYLRALQLSQNATINDVPQDQRDKLGSGGP